MPRILQLTDIHLHSDASYFHPGNKPDARRQTVRSEHGTLHNGNVNVRNSLQLVIQHALDNTELGGGDLVVLTGDLVQDFERGTYLLLRRIIEGGFSKPGRNGPQIRYLAGNHDERGFVRDLQRCPGSTYPTSCFATVLDGWLVLGLDTEAAQQPHVGPGGGGCTREELEFLRQQLEEHASHPAVIFMHHPPVESIGSFLDNQEGDAPGSDLFEPSHRQQLEKILATHQTQIHGIFCGHIHQEFYSHVAGVPLFATPSTMAQIKPRAAEYRLDSKRPGYRVIELAARGDGNRAGETGGMSTRIARLPNDCHAQLYTNHAPTASL